MATDAGTVIQALRHTHQTDAGVPDALLTSPRRWYYRLTAGLVTFGLVALLLVWRDCPTPFVLGFLAAAGGAVATALFLSHARLQNIAVTFASSFLTLALIEGGIYVTTSSDIRAEMESKVPYYIADPDLGYGPQPGVKVEVRKYHREHLLYDTIYTIGHDGLRQIPESLQGEACNVVFFGDSLMFGEGVGDDETLPASVLKGSGGRYRGYNFGFHGYGPHQMLRTVELGRLDKIVEGQPHVSIYLGIEAHVARAAGKVNWDLYGPRYQLSGKRGVEFIGPFHGAAYKTIHDSFKRSFLFRFLEDTFIMSGIMSGHFDPADIPLYLAILERTREELASRYQARFVVLFWDDREGDTLTDQILQGLREKHFEVIALSQIIPDIESDKRSYIFSEFDLHLNARAYELIGTSLAHQLSQQSCRM
jgi:hypothetical protein